MSGIWTETNWVAQHEDGHTVPVLIDEGNMSMTYTADAPGRWKVTPRPLTLREKVAARIVASSDHSLKVAAWLADAVLNTIAEHFTTETSNEVVPNLDGLSPQGIYVRAYGESRAAVVHQLRGGS